MTRTLVLVLAVTVPTLTACGGGRSAEAPATAQAEQEMDRAAFVEHGAAVYQVSGCAACHGTADGSTPAQEGTPPLVGFVDRFGLDDATREPAIEWIRSGAVHDQRRDIDGPFPGFDQFLIAARLYTTLIAGENHLGFLEHMRLEEPMPHWAATLSQRDLDAVLAYLIALSET